MIRLANSPVPHVTSVAQSVLDLFCAKTDSTHMQRPLPAPVANSEFKLAPDPGPVAKKGTISPDDWDDLFHAVQTRLETCVDEALNNSLVLPLPKRHAVTKAAVLDCVASMKHLHASLTLERQSQQRS